jgi:hypothetical protein
VGFQWMVQVTPLYFTIVTHNEENQPFNLTNFYTLSITTSQGTTSKTIHIEH